MPHPIKNFEQVKISVAITRDCRQGGYGFSVARLRKVCQEPTDAHDIQWEGFRFRIFARAAPDFVDVVGVKLAPPPLFASFALRAFPDLCAEPLADLTPLAIVERLVCRFGLDCSVGGKIGRFFVAERVLKAARAELVPVSASQRPDHGYVQAAYSLVGPTCTKFAIAFVLDTTEYGNWVRSHDS